MACRGFPTILFGRSLGSCQELFGPIDPAFFAAICLTSRNTSSSSRMSVGNHVKLICPVSSVSLALDGSKL